MTGNFLPTLFLAVVLGTVLPSATSGEAVSAEPGFSETIPGTYKLTYRGGLIKLEAVKSYHPCGRYESGGRARFLGMEKKLVHRGRWAIENGELVYTLSESSTPKEAPVGVPLRFRLLKHDGRTLTYRDETREKTYSETLVIRAES